LSPSFARRIAPFFLVLAGGVPIAAATPGTGLRIQATATLTGSTGTPVTCLTPWALPSSRSENVAPVAVRRALAQLGLDAALSGEKKIVERDVVVRFSSDRGSPDRLDILDDNANGRPDAVDAVLAGVVRTQRTLQGGLELSMPTGIEIVLARLGSGIEGVTLPAHDGRVTIWIDPTGRSPVALRRIAEHQAAHAITAGLGLGAGWAEAFATWASGSLEGGPDDRGALVLAQRLSRLAEGLDRDDLAAAAGNAAWFAFLDEAYGRTAVKLAVEELARGGSSRAALDRALRRFGSVSFDDAFRDFQLWSTFTGPRNDGRHFSFAGRLPAPTFAGTAEMLPALSIQADPDVAPLGAASVLLTPAERSGGLAVRFEGDRTARWSVDLLLVRGNGSMHRVPLSLDDEDAGDVTVPLQDLREAVLLVRNLDEDGRAPRKYTWSAFVEPGYPAEIVRLAAEPAGGRSGTIVSWETVGERGVLGFNVVRSRPGDPSEVKVNPVWIPAIGDASATAAYSFLDTGARPGIAYEYRIEAVTPEGLVSRSDAVPASSR
jgi:hypothetical protein